MASLNAVLAIFVTLLLGSVTFLTVGVRGRRTAAHSSHETTTTQAATAHSHPTPTSTSPPLDVKTLPAKTATDYTVGWICAIHTEYTAAQAFLEERHERCEGALPRDSNEYTLGRIGKHNIVITVFPRKENGLCSAANVATSMLNSFPNIRIGLMVGIGGGAPSPKHDIRLGDVVVSTPHNCHGGIFQYDFGKTIQLQKFKRIGSLNQPPKILLGAVNGLKSQYELYGHQFDADINSIFDRNPRLKKNYSRPHPDSDRLYRSHIVHPQNETKCELVCGQDESTRILRSPRTDIDDPAIHYGLIASANNLMKDASIRDKISKDEDVLCFETTAAGLMNDFPCLVIRGICDYSDSHKTKEWQGYAAMVAAAYAKDILHRIPSKQVENEKKIIDTLSDALSDVRDAVEKGRETAQRHLVLKEDEAKQRLSDKQLECHQLFRLASSSQDTTYEGYKGRVEPRVEGTCEWFLNHENYQNWLHRDSEDSALLLVSAYPGCGKSVLAKYLIDEGLPRSSTICYFFFKSQDQNTAHQALCALLHQLFSYKPFLIKHAMEEYKKNGRNLINSPASLWTILGNAVSDPTAGPIILVLDAMDECAEFELENLIRKIKYLCSSGHSSRLKCLLTSRPYEGIMGEFQRLLEFSPHAHISGDEESESISQEINLVIQDRVKQLAKKKKLSDDVVTRLKEKLCSKANRTYLWVYLVFDFLKKNIFKKTPNGVDEMIKVLPATIIDAYEQILSKVHRERDMVRRALCMILAASRPLTISEMNVALNIGSAQSVHDLDLEKDEDFKTRLINLCGLFVSVHHGKVYFLHQSAREFLLERELSAIPQGSGWQGSITMRDAHSTLAEACVLYLVLLDKEVCTPNTSLDDDELPNEYRFLEYSAENWGPHYRDANDTTCTDLASSILRICGSESRSYLAWLRIFQKTNYWFPRGEPTILIISSWFGHEGIVKLLLDQGASTEAADKYGRTPLSYATQQGHEGVVKLLLDQGASIEAADKYGRTPLSHAALLGREGTAKLLLDHGASTEVADNEGQTPLSSAASQGHEAIVELFIDYRASLDTTCRAGRTALSYAAEKGHEGVVRRLVDHDANLDIVDQYGRTALSYAAERNHEAIIHNLRISGEGHHARQTDRLEMATE